MMRGRPSCLFQSAGGEANRIFLAFLSSMRIICQNRVSWRDWIIAVSLGWFVSRTSASLISFRAFSPLVLDPSGSLGENGGSAYV